MNPDDCHTPSEQEAKAKKNSKVQPQNENESIVYSEWIINREIFVGSVTCEDADNCEGSQNDEFYAEPTCPPPPVSQQTASTIDAVRRSAVGLRVCHLKKGPGCDCFH